jgi:hypothetical protein
MSAECRRSSGSEMKLYHMTYEVYSIDSLNRITYVMVCNVVISVIIFFIKLCKTTVILMEVMQPGMSVRCVSRHYFLLGNSSQLV